MLTMRNRPRTNDEIRVRALQGYVALPAGAEVAWSLTDYAGKTDGLSELHRAENEEYTYCGEAIPPQTRHLPPIRNLSRCRRCDVLHLSATSSMRAAS